MTVNQSFQFYAEVLIFLMFIKSIECFFINRCLLCHQVLTLPQQFFFSKSRYAFMLCMLCFHVNISQHLIQLRLLSSPLFSFLLCNCNINMILPFTLSFHENGFANKSLTAVALVPKIIMSPVKIVVFVDIRPKLKRKFGYKFLPTLTMSCFR